MYSKCFSYSFVEKIITCFYLAYAFKEELLTLRPTQPDSDYSVGSMVVSSFLGLISKWKFLSQQQAACPLAEEDRREKFHPEVIRNSHFPFHRFYLMPTRCNFCARENESEAISRAVSRTKKRKIARGNCPTENQKHIVRKILHANQTLSRLVAHFLRTVLLSLDH